MNMPASVARAAIAWSLAAFAAGGCGASEPAPAPLVPQLEGAVAIPGLSAPVLVMRDRWGVPHIEAASQADLFIAQGFVQAQDRLFQMDLWRRSVQGRLSEVLGGNFIERDAMTRRVQYRGNLEVEWASYGKDARAIAAAFVTGVNAWVSLARERPPEEFVLAGWMPEPWVAEDLLNRTDAFLASQPGAQDEVFRARLVSAVGPRVADALLPLEGGLRTIVPSELDPGVVSPIVAAAVGRVGTAPFFTGLAAPLASNAWAVHGSQSATGSPLLASDPHRLLTSPSLRYLVHLKAPGWHVAGATAPWMPGVAIGHNERIAWSMTTVAADTQDLYLERTNPANPRQVWDDGQWVDMEVSRQVIAVKGASKPFEYEDLRTRRGVVVAMDGGRNLAFVLRWSGTEPGAAAELGALAINRARSWDEFRAAATGWKMPAAEFVYADVDGLVARQVAALTPLRRGSNGAMPAPAWTGEHDWRGWAPYEGQPSAVNPREGYVRSANDSRVRRDRIAERLSVEAPHSVESTTRLQFDVYASDANRIAALLEPLRAERADAEAARRELVSWDRQFRADSRAARTYLAWERVLLRRLAARRLPSELVEMAVARFRHALVSALLQPSGAWFDGNAARVRDGLLLDALVEAVSTPVSGGEASSSAPPGLNQVWFAHPLGVTPAARERFNRGPFALPGSSETVFAVTGVAPGRIIGPSFRAIFDLGDWDRSVVTQAPGQSGSPGSPHFSDLAAPWAAGEYFPLLFTASAVRASTTKTLTLHPRPDSSPVP
jgi:penicillin amidase